MGDVADMMVEGILCQSCGVYIEESEAQGVPRDCEDCQKPQKPVHKPKKQRGTFQGYGYRNKGR